MSKYIRRARDLLEERHSEIDVYSEQCAPALTALHKTLNDAQFLIQKHCTSSKVWLLAAVELVENTSVFAEVILDLTWYIYALQIAIEVCANPSKYHPFNIPSLLESPREGVNANTSNSVRSSALEQEEVLQYTQLIKGAGTSFQFSCYFVVRTPTGDCFVKKLRSLSDCQIR